MRPSRLYRNLLLEEVFSKVGLQLDPHGRVIRDLLAAPIDSEVRGASLLSTFGPIDFAKRVTILNANVISWGSTFSEPKCIVIFAFYGSLLY